MLLSLNFLYLSILKQREIKMGLFDATCNSIFSRRNSCLIYNFGLPVDIALFPRLMILELTITAEKSIIAILHFAVDGMRYSVLGRQTGVLFPTMTLQVHYERRRTLNLIRNCRRQLPLNRHTYMDNMKGDSFLAATLISSILSKIYQYSEIRSEIQ